MPKREEVTVGGKTFRLKESLRTREYASLAFAEDYVYLAGVIVELGNNDEVPMIRREKIAPYWQQLCSLFFDDISGLGLDEIDGMDMSELNGFFGECAVSMIRVPSNTNATSTDSSTAPAP